MYLVLFQQMTLISGTQSFLKAYSNYRDKLSVRSLDMSFGEEKLNKNESMSAIIPL